MRVALLSTIELAHGGAGAAAEPIAFAPLGARNLAAQQLDVALKLGAERIVVHCQSLGPEILALQHEAEAAGASFHAITGTRPLSGLVSAADDLLVLADGLAADGAAVADALGERPGVLVLPAGSGVAAGYERIDGERAWAGAMLLRGPAVERLADLPGDVEPASALLRIALQGGTRCVPLPQALVDSGQWLLARESAQLQDISDRRMSASLAAQGWFAPGIALADRIAGRMARGLFDRGFGSSAVQVMAYVTLACSLAWGWAVSPGTGFLGVGGAAFLFAGAAALGRLEREGRPEGKLSYWLRNVFIDGGILFLAGLPWPNPIWEQLLFGPVMLLGWLFVLAQSSLHPATALARDRVALSLLLAAAAFGGVLAPGIRAIAICAMLATLWLSTRPRLTVA